MSSTIVKKWVVRQVGEDKFIIAGYCYDNNVSPKIPHWFVMNKYGSKEKVFTEMELLEHSFKIGKEIRDGLIRFRCADFSKYVSQLIKEAKEFHSELKRLGFRLLEVV